MIVSGPNLSIQTSWNLDLDPNRVEKWEPDFYVPDTVRTGFTPLSVKVIHTNSTQFRCFDILGFVCCKKISLPNLPGLVLFTERYEGFSLLFSTSDRLIFYRYMIYLFSLNRVGTPDLSQHFILVEIICANQSESKFCQCH